MGVKEHMRKLLITAVVAGSMVFGAGHAIAAPGPDKDNGHNHRGQCTAFFNGQKKGNDSSSVDVQQFYNDCQGDIMGQAADNGRYTQCFVDGNMNNDNTDDC